MENSQRNIAFMQSMCSRICHDLAAPLGALSLAVEMLEDGGKTDDNGTFDLLSDTVKDACLRLDLFRFLVGFSAVSHRPSLNQIKVLLKNYTLKKKIQLHWMDEEEREGIYARLLLSLVLIAVESLPRGGEITIWPSRITGQSIEKIIRAQGVPCLLKKDYITALEDPEASVSSETSVIFYLKYLASQFGQTVQVEFQKDRELILRVIG